MNKRLLILTDAPTAPLFSPRIRSLLFYLEKSGWKCTVASEKALNTEFVYPHCQHIQWSYYHERKAFSNKIKWCAAQLLNAKDIAFSRFISNKLKEEKFDALLCSSFNEFPLQTATTIADQWKLPLVIDLRDITEQWGNTNFTQHSINTPWTLFNQWLMNLYKRRIILVRNRVLQKATAITTVSSWHQALLSKFNPHTYLVYNGFKEDEFFAKDVQSDQFIISYSGKLYDLNFRDPQLLFEALRLLIDKVNIAPEDIKVEFHIDNGSIVPTMQMIEKYQLQQICSVNEYIPQKELIPLMHKSSILLVLTCKSTPNGTHGIMGTKFFEALGVEKPVLCVRSDEECLAQVIQETNAGLAGTNAEEVADFILDKYKEWKNKGFTRQAVDQAQKRLFTRQYQAQQFEQILLKAIDERR